MHLAPLQRVTSNTTSYTAISPTHTHVDEFDSPRSKSQIRRSTDDSAKSDKKEEEAEAKNTRVELEQDAEDENPAPFAYKPFALASLLDPKNLDGLEEMGGVDGLLKGLGTSRTKGLSSHSLRESPDAAKASSELSPKPTHDIEQGTIPSVVVTSPDGKGDGDGGGDAYGAPLDVRRRVYGPNTLPHRPTKSLLALMWMALKDKVLVRC